MKIFKVEIQNFRLLKDFSIDLENELSLIVGKNNTGKTSILVVLDKFLNYSEKNSFSFDDFNINFKKNLTNLMEKPLLSEEDFHKQGKYGIKLKLFIEYYEKDNLENISHIMMDLDPNNNVIVLGFEYIIEFQKYLDLKNDLNSLLEEQKKKKGANDNHVVKDIYPFLRQNHSEYFTLNKKSFFYDMDKKKVDESDFISIDKNLKDIINFKFINAKREVTNKENNKTLSGQTARIYNRTETSESHNEKVDEFKDKLRETDKDLSSIYSVMFSNIIQKIEKYGGIKLGESQLEIVSTLQHKELLQGNTTVVYNHDADNQLPEYYNGLGYMNLISILFEIEILVMEFKRDKDEKPADINLLFIEEPEAHTHPQMQYVFIKNIKEFLKEGIIRKDDSTLNKNLQYVISTHSSHIVSESNFDDIKYLKKEESDSVIAKNLKDLENEYEDDDNAYKFLKQYLTLNRAELFFADKAIFIEGDTERILLPAMMKKIDQENKNNKGDKKEMPLLSQNISIIEVGAHSQIFEIFINYIGLHKCLIITDIDSFYKEFLIDENGEPEKHQNGNLKSKVIKCSACNSSASHTSNSSIRFFHSKKEDDLNYFKSLTFDWKILRKNKRKNCWVSNRKGSLLITYQIEEENYYPRSFEDAFFHINKHFITNGKFPSLIKKHLDNYKSDKIGVFEFSEKSVDKKSQLAIEVLLNSEIDKDGNQFSNWKIPAYIKEGLSWLSKD
jgi:putative ATP-dependent endonuclease of OLD family